VWVKLNDFIGGKRDRAVAFSINGYGYVGTGTDTAEVVRSDFWRYDPSSDSWTQIAPIPGPARRDAVAFDLNGFGYVGTGMSDHVSANGNILSDFWRYNAVMNEWDSIAPFPGNQGGGVYFSTGFSVGGKGYVCGGKTSLMLVLELHKMYINGIYIDTILEITNGTKCLICPET
jgi:N-acetylneuraminic acid mutarotase